MILKEKCLILKNDLMSRVVIIFPINSTQLQLTNLNGINVENYIIISICRIIYRIFMVCHFFEQRKGVSFSPCEQKGYRINIGAKEQPVYGENRTFLAYDMSSVRKFVTSWLALRRFEAKLTPGTESGREDRQYSMRSSRR